MFGYFGSNQILALLAGLLIATSWLMGRREYRMERTVITIALLGLSVLAMAPRLPSSVLADIDTPTARYLVKVVAREKEPFRLLVTGPGAWQSGVLADGSNRLIFWYTRAMANIVRQAPKPDNILILGGGALSMPRYFAEKYPDSHVTVVEIDPELRAIAKEYFFYKDRRNVEIINQDARAYLGKNNKTYDVILVDAFSDREVPFSLTTKEYVRSLARATHPGSVVAVNIIASSKNACGELLGGIDASYKTAFRNGVYFGELEGNLAARQNIIATYSQRPLTWLDQTSAVKLKPASAAFSDNFSPTDRLNFECLQQTS
jgi:predicted membrane-bound spermidine synthase